MSNLFNLSEHPAITEALREAAKKLIEETTKAGYVNPKAVCVGLCGCQFQNSFFLFRAGAIIQSFFSAVENFFQKDLVCIVIVFTFALQN